MDVAMLLLGTLSHLHTTAEVRSCWESVLRALNPSGILVIELQHPADMFDGAFTRGDMWQAPLENEQEVIMEFGTDDDFFDVETQVHSLPTFAIFDYSALLPQAAFSQSSKVGKFFLPTCQRWMAETQSMPIKQYSCIGSLFFYYAFCSPSYH